MSFQGNAFQQNAFQVGVPSSPSGSGPVGVQLCDNPVRPKRHYGFTDLAVNLLLTTLAVTATNVPREALYTQQNKVYQQPAPQSVNLLTTTLAPTVAATPFKQTDWPNPQPRKVTQDTRSVNLQATTLAPTADLPKVQSSLPDSVAPRWGVLRYEQNIKQANPGDIPVPPVGTEVLRAATFTVVHGKPQQRVIDPPNTLPLRAVVVATAPFNQTDWPNPRVKKYQQPDYQQGSLPLIAYNVPYAPTDNLWPNPPVKRIIQPQLYVNTMPLLNPPVASTQLLRMLMGFGS